MHTHTKHKHTHIHHTHTTILHMHALLNILTYECIAAGWYECWPAADWLDGVSQEPITRVMGS